MDFVDRMTTTSFLGKEFLTWLWYITEKQEGLVEISDGGGAAEVWLCDSIVLSGASVGAERVTIRTEDPASCVEARMALRQGKKVEKARVRFVRGQREWTVTISGESLALSSVKIPALLTREEDEKLHERLSLLEQVDGMVSSLFMDFLRIRTDEAAWPDELASLKAWIVATT